MKKMTTIRKSIFPVAGLGTRFLPASKVLAKEMFPVVDKPIIQYATEEAINAGITELIFVISRTKTVIEDHYDKAYELESELIKKNKLELVNLINNIVPESVNCVFTRQSEPLGLGHAVLCTKQIVGDEPFAVILPDDVIDDDSTGCLRQMVDAFKKTDASLVAVENVKREDTEKYGIVNVTPFKSSLYKIASIIEKPKPSEAPSTLGVVGRYILTPRIFKFLEMIECGAGGELQLTDAIAALIKHETVFAYEFEGRRFDCGSKAGFLRATINYAKKHPELKDEISDILSQR